MRRGGEERNRGVENEDAKGKKVKIIYAEVRAATSTSSQENEIYLVPLYL